MKKARWNTGYVIFLTMALIVAGCTGKRPPIPTDVRQSLFSKADAALKDAKEVEAAKYAPETIKEGEEAYQEAAEAIDKGKSLSTIRRYLQKATTGFEKAAHIARKGVPMFYSVNVARTDAQKAGGPKQDPETWNEAEELLNEAMEILEAENDAKTKARTMEAEVLYRKAELVAIKVTILQAARDALKKTEEAEAEDQAPETIVFARGLIREASKLLNKNRYDTTEPERLAGQAIYECNHALYLSQSIQKQEKEDLSAEKILLRAEHPLKTIAEKIGVPAAFDQGPDAPTRTILNAIERLRSENEKLTEELKGMEIRLSDMEKAAPTLDETTIEEPPGQRIGEKITRITGMMDPDQANVDLTSEGHIVIRLTGLTYATAQSDIRPKHFGLLDKVSESASLFPGCRVIVSGHTDSMGEAHNNQRLSEERAKGVLSYLISKGFPIDSIKSVGLGESRPIADNKTRSGRAKNRRIEVAIIP